jgi:hypothetical protein
MTNEKAPEGAFFMVRSSLAHVRPKGSRAGRASHATFLMAWQGQTAEQIKAMTDGLERLKALGE